VDVDAAGNMKPSKVTSTERIDGVVALIMAVDLMQRHTTPNKPTYRIHFWGPGTSPP
jgi:phage terminase large subunit-like protein